MYIRRRARWLLRLASLPGFACVLLLSVVLLAQESRTGQKQDAPSNAGSQQASTPAKGEEQQKQSPSQPSSEHKISSQEADELFRSVDEIIKFSSQESGLPVRHAVKRRLISRDELSAYLEKHMDEDKDSQRLKRSELVLKKFGLLPRNFDLHAFLLALLREQVAGYYDVKTQTVNLLDWVDAEQQKPVLAHELTHALQDQSFHLEKWMKSVETDIDTKRNPTPEDIEKDEAQSVRQAVVEGQAMAVLVDYILAPTGQSLISSPQIVEALKAGMLVGTADSVQFQNAPIFLKEILTFPYRYGLDFVSDVLTKDGKEKAFAGVLAHPPHTTREIMEPKTYLAGQHVDPLPLPDFVRLMKNYERFDAGSMGEFDVALLLDEYAGSDVAKGLYPAWRGGYYYAARPKGGATDSLAIVYVSEWASPQSAQRFAGIYTDSLKKRYHSVRPVAVEEAKAGVAASAAGNREWLTEDGDVIVDTEGAMVFITESVDDVTSAKLKEAVLGASQAPKSTKLQAPQMPALFSAVCAVLKVSSISVPPSSPAGNERRLPLR